MLIIPAIDLKDSCVVRYTQGAIDKKVYSQDPVKSAKHWQRQGAERLHVVDLDGAFTGVAKNIAVVKEIIAAVNIPVQVGGGLRSMDVVEDIISAGAARVILGTKAVSDNEFLKNVLQRFGDKVTVSVDTKEGVVVVEGWQSEGDSVEAIAFVEQLKALGLEEVIYTDVLKDGTLKGPNIAGIKKLLKTGIRVIASGGISSLDDLTRLKPLVTQGLVGVIVGKALYEGRFTLAQAIKEVS